MKKSYLSKKRILVAPLNWGLGHATRCIPIINALINSGFEPVIASDGAALSLLQKEFPFVETLELPSYNIRYPKKAKYFKVSLLKRLPQLIKCLKNERNMIKKFVATQCISGIISDNRFSARHHSIPSIYITHQVCVLSGKTTWLSSKIHQSIIAKFDKCWVPDYSGPTNLSGGLGHSKHYKREINYLGPLSRLKKKDLPIKYDLLVVLSGPEPQRAFLEIKLLNELEHYKGSVCFVKGLVNGSDKKHIKGHITIYNYMTSKALEIAINESQYLLSRSGYSAIMDYVKLEKKAFLIPTPGQFEQEYLADKFKQEGVAPSCKQHEFSVEMLEDLKRYSGFKFQENDIDYEPLFCLF